MYALYRHVSFVLLFIAIAHFSFAEPPLRIMHTRSAHPKGTVLLLTNGGYTKQPEEAADPLLIQQLNKTGYNVASFLYTGPSGLLNEDSLLRDAIQAWRQLKTAQPRPGRPGGRLVIMGIRSGGQLGARVTSRLSIPDAPDDLILLSPKYLDETITGTVEPLVIPPIHPTRLLVILSPIDSASDQKATIEYAKTWKGFDGQAKYLTAADQAARLKTLAAYLSTIPQDTTHTAVNPAAVAVAGYSPKRHEEKCKLIAAHKYDLLMIGNSITNNFEKSEYQSVWRQFFEPRNAIDLGYSGYRTENIIYNLQHGELEGQSPKVAVIEIGTNNVDEKNYPTRHTAGQLAGGIKAIVDLLRQQLPDTKIILLRCFPGCYGGPNPTSHRMILDRASEIVSALADNKHIFYCDVNHQFLNLDGTIKKDRMPDWLHPSPAGAKAWAQAMEPLLSQLMGDSSLDHELPANSALIPTPKLEEDFYQWWPRHEEAVRIKDSVDPEIVLIGNSITHMWGGVPALINNDGQPRPSNGPRSWAGLFTGHRVLNLGFGWDRLQNMLWRIDHGELDGLHPRLVVMHLGTNNTSETKNARMNTAEEIVEGIRAVVGRVRSKLPNARIVLMEIFPREKEPANPRRVLINTTNRLLELWARQENITLLNIGPSWLAPDGTMLPDVTRDLCHPTDKGYQIWADAIRPFVEAP